MEEYFMTNNYTIGRANECDIVPNATDKPIELLMHHFHARSLIINLKTGDILTCLLSESHHASAQSNFENSSVTQLQHNIFLEQDGEKALFMLKTNFKSPVVNRYIEMMKERGVRFAGELISDVENGFSEFEKYRYGEISSGFIFDLTSPCEIKTMVGGEVGSQLVQGVVSEVGTDKTTLPNIREQIQLHYKYSNIGKMIAHASDNLPEQLENSKIDLSDLSDVSGHIADSITMSMNRERPFSSDHLYDLKYVDYIMNTLSFIQEKGIDDLVLASLSGVFSKELARRIMQINEYEDGSSEEFFHLAFMAQKIIPFAIDILLRQESELMKKQCDMQMQDELIRLNKVVFIKMKHFGYDQDKLSSKNIVLSEDFALPELTYKA
jgi:hypothetical protein